MRNLFYHESPPVCLHILGQGLANTLHSQGRKCFMALNVICKDRRIRAFLEEHDPKALAQCEACIQGEMECDYTHKEPEGPR